VTFRSGVTVRTIIEVQTGGIPMMQERVEAPQAQLSRRVAPALWIAPVVLLGVNVAGFAFPPTRPLTASVFAVENGPVELLTFLLLILGGLRGLSLAARARRLRLGRATVAFYGAFAVGLLVVGMEEIAWGQWFFHWETPRFWLEHNRQGETTLHNTLTQGRTEVFRIAFAAGGLIGIWCARLPALANVAAPAILAPLFWIVGAHAGVDLLLDFVAPSSLIEKVFNRSCELTELYVGFAGWMYVLLVTRRIARQTGAEPSSGDVAVALASRG
jgi:hypothetical protein